MTLQEIISKIDGRLLTPAAHGQTRLGSDVGSIGSTYPDSGHGNSEYAGNREATNAVSVGDNPVKRPAADNSGCAGDEADKEKNFEFAFASDLMSDVLTLRNDNVVLITGLATLQTIRTAEMADINCIIFVRNKKAGKEMIELANESGIDLIECRYSMFKTSGLIFQSGLKPVY